MLLFCVLTNLFHFIHVHIIITIQGFMYVYFVHSSQCACILAADQCATIMNISISKAFTPHNNIIIVSR